MFKQSPSDLLLGEAGWGLRLNYLEPKRIRVILVINFDGIIPIYLCPALDTGNDTRFAANGYLILHRARKFTADDTFVDEFIAFFQFAFCMPLCHPRGGTSSAGRA